MSAGEKARHAQTSKLRTTSTCADALTLASWTAAAFSLALCTPPFEKAANAVLMIGPLVIAPAGYSLALMLASAAVTLIMRVRRSEEVSRDDALRPRQDRKRNRSPQDAPRAHCSSCSSRRIRPRRPSRGARQARCVRAQRRTQPYRPLDRQRTRRLRHRRGTCDVGAFLPYQQALHGRSAELCGGSCCGGGAKRASERIRHRLLRATRNRIWSRDRPLRRR